MPLPPSTRYRVRIFVLQLVYLGVLAALAWAYNAGRLIEPLRSIPDPIGSMPLAVPWFGALGGVLISLAGIHMHRYDWDPEYWSWHIVRPLVGAAVAVVAVMIIQVGILGAGVEPADTGAGTKNVFYYLVAFIAGYREATFRGMVKRLADAILTSTEEGLPPRIVGVAPPNGPADGGSIVQVKGTGFTGAEEVSFGLTRAPGITVASDTEIEATAPPGAAGQTVSVSVTTPKGSASMTDAYTYDAVP